MISLMALGLTVMVLVGWFFERLAPKPQKPKGFHYPIAQEGFEGSPYLDDYDYFEPSKFTGECVCRTCARQREKIRSQRAFEQATFEQEFPNLAKFLSK